ncbi:T9SS type A sorting domain-containing protein [Siphonobacter sp. BAB-5405]|uniref:T9SS type A sorting domain-containing protein n=1 Tax=Siphonobacter sp. BAB-5405 TaxID=1864825 RepID=UPI0011AF0DD5|nr:T9SS type A sorting domain-containing protein [Siphonobacter sp. BAB-5405]
MLIRFIYLLLGCIGWLALPGYSQSRVPHPQKISPYQATKRKVDSLQQRTTAGYFSAHSTAIRTISRPLAGGRQLATTCDSYFCTRIRSPLPVTWVDVTGQRLSENQVKITWETATEVNNQYFEVQRSWQATEGFETIATVPGGHTSSRTLRYESIDANPFAGITYYRIRQLDTDGSYSFSKVVSVKGYEQVLAVRAFPNPAVRQKITFQLSGLKAPQAVAVELYNSRGMLVYQRKDQPLSDDFQLEVDPTAHLAAGFFFVKIRTNTQLAQASFVLLP